MARWPGLAGLGGALVLLAGACLPLAGPPSYELWDARRTVLVLLLLAAGGIYLLACRAVLRGPAKEGLLPLILLVAVAVRVIAWAAPPYLSSDIFRYVWDGRVQMAGINPYGHLPVDPTLAFLRDAPGTAQSVWGSINRAATAPTIYPPVAQALFLLVAAVWPGVWPVKLLMLLLDGVSIAAMLRLLRLAGRPREHVLLYAWAPLPAWEFAGNGHIDAASLTFLALALLAAAWRRSLVAGALLGAAVLCKFLPLAVAPALWRRWDWRLPLGIGVIIAVGYLCFIGAGWGVLGYLQGYGTEEGLSSGGGVLWMRLLHTVGALPPWLGTAYLGCAAAGLGLLALWCARDPLPAAPSERVPVLGRRALLLAGAVMAVITPSYPWYLCWLTWLTCLQPTASVLCLTALAPFLYWDPERDQVLWPALTYLPAALLVLRDIRSSRP